MTLRELLDLTGAARGHWVLPGTPESVADTLERWFPERAADGFDILPAYFHPPGQHIALRDHLGLARPAWRK